MKRLVIRPSKDSVVVSLDGWAVNLNHAAVRQFKEAISKLSPPDERGIAIKIEDTNLTIRSLGDRIAFELPSGRGQIDLLQCESPRTETLRALQKAAAKLRQIIGLKS
jgi:hypothetical protein